MLRAVDLHALIEERPQRCHLPHHDCEKKRRLPVLIGRVCPGDVLHHTIGVVIFHRKYERLDCLLQRVVVVSTQRKHRH